MAIRGIPLFALAAVFAIACGSPAASPSLQSATSRPAPSHVSQSTPRPTVAASPSPVRVPSGDAPFGETTKARVVDVVDGDTIVVKLGGEELHVRYIGIDAPERGDGALARQATKANARLVGDKRVWLEMDTSQTDQFDRLLRHVWLKDGDNWTLVNGEIVRLGLAEAVSYPPDTLYDDVYSDLQAQAQEDELGIWAPTD